MIYSEMGNLKRGQEIKGPDGTNYIIHHNHTSGEGMIVATRSVVIPHKALRDWEKVGTFDATIGPGTYIVTFDKKLD